MNTIQAHGYGMLARTRGFGDAHADTFPAGSLGDRMFAEIDRALAEIDEQGARQVAGHDGAREGTTSKAAAREVLREWIDRLSDAARVMAQDKPGLAQKFRRLRRRSDTWLVNTARAFANEAVPLAKMFVEHGFDETFIDDLRRDIDGFVDAVQDHASAKGQHVSSRVAIEKALDAGFKAARRLDVIVAEVLRKDPAAIAAWKLARHIEKPSQVEKPETPAPAPPKIEAA